MHKPASTTTDWLIPGNIRKAITNAMLTEQRGQAHGLVGPLLRNLFQEARQTITERYPRGDIQALKLSGVTDQVIRTLFDYAPSNRETQPLPLSIVAAGGYGRGELSPYSDIDLLFLHEPGKENLIRPQLDAILYALWDSGLKIGHGVHTPASAIAFCKQDMTARTAWLEARFLTGNTIIYDGFSKQFDKLRRSTSREFVNAKLEELEARHDISEQSRFLVEPDIKEGKGGLRDIHTIGWLYHYVYGSLIDESAITRPVFEKQDYRDYIRARRFLQTIRTHLHTLRRCDDNRLSFDVQPELAERLNYAERPGISSAERLMKHYFVTASDTGRLLRIFCARLEAENTKRLPRLPANLPRKLLKDEAQGKPNLTLQTGRLHFDKPDLASKTPRDWFRLMRAFSRQEKYDVHPAALTIIRQNLPLLTRTIRRDDEINHLFRRTILRTHDPLKVLRIMIETGLLGKFIPAYGKITGRIVYGLYRRFTLDEQTLQAIALLHDIANGNEKEEHPISTSILNNAKDIYPFYLAVLFHELIWSVKEHSPAACQRLVARVCSRLGLEKQIAADIAWVAAHRMLMIHTIERRTLADAQTAELFCFEVQNQRRLDLLLIVTVCHLKVVDIHSWDKRMRRRLQVLYESATVWFDGGSDALARHQKNRTRTNRKAIEKTLAGWSDKEKAILFDKVEAQALHTVEPALWGRFAPLMRNAEKESLPGAVSVSLRGDGTIEAIVYGHDRDGLLSDLAGAISALGISFLSVQAITTRDNRVIDIFVLQSLSGEPLSDPNQVKSIHEVLLTTVRTAPKKPPKITRRLGDRRALFQVTPQVSIDLEASEDCLVVEAVGLDRPGLLYQLTRELLEIGVMIRTAHVATYGERAVDSFYLQDAPGYKITNKRRIQSIERRLRNVLDTES